MKIFFAIFILTTHWCFAQNHFSFSDFSQNNAKITSGTYADGFLNSNSLTNTFLHQFNKNGFLSEDIKKENSQTIFPDNRIGADLDYGIFYSQKTDSSFGYFIHIADRAHLNAAFTKDFFDLLFYGNKKFAGDTAVLDNTIVNFLRFQQIQSGFVITREDGKRFGFALSYLKGEENFSMNIRNAKLITNEFGESLSAYFDGEINRTDTANKGIGAFNGTGFSVDLFYEAPIALKSFTGKLKVEGNDIGFIQWNKKSLTYSEDTAVFFNGVFIPDILQPADSALTILSSDTIRQQINASQTPGVYKTPLPAMLKLLWTMETNKVLFSLGINNRFNANYNAFFRVKGGYKVSSFLAVSANAGYGGYGNFCFGAEASINLKKINIVLGSNNIEGIAFPRYSGGNSAYIMARMGL